MRYLVIALLLMSCQRLRIIETPQASIQHIILEGFCTGFAVSHPEVGVMLAAEDFRCRDLNISTRQYLSDNLPGETIIRNGRQYLIIDPLAFEDFLDRLVDEGLIQVVREEQ